MMSHYIDLTSPVAPKRTKHSPHILRQRRQDPNDEDSSRTQFREQMESEDSDSAETKFFQRLYRRSSSESSREEFDISSQEESKISEDEDPGITDFGELGEPPFFHNRETPSTKPQNPKLEKKRRFREESPIHISDHVQPIEIPAPEPELEPPRRPFRTRSRQEQEPLEIVDDDVVMVEESPTRPTREKPALKRDNEILRRRDQSPTRDNVDREDRYDLRSRHRSRDRPSSEEDRRDERQERDLRNRLRPRDRSSRFDPPEGAFRPQQPPRVSSFSVDRPLPKLARSDRREWTPPREMGTFMRRTASEPSFQRKRNRDEDDDLHIDHEREPTLTERRRKKPRTETTEEHEDNDFLLAQRLQMQEYIRPSFNRTEAPQPSPTFRPYALGPVMGPMVMLHPHMMPHHFHSLADLHRHVLPHHFHPSPPEPPRHRQNHSNPLYNLQYVNRDFTADDYEMLLALDKDVKKKTLTKKQISGIKPKVLKEKADEVECVICLDMCSVGSKIKSLTCAHTFHAECIDKWLHESKQCPICKTEVS